MRMGEKIPSFRINSYHFVEHHCFILVIELNVTSTFPKIGGQNG